MSQKMDRLCQADAFRFPQRRRKNKSASIIVCCIALSAIRYRENRVLQHSRAIGDPTEMIQVQFRQLVQRLLSRARGELDLWTLHAVAADV